MDTQMNTQSMSHKVKKHFQFCFLYGLEQLIKSPTPVTCSISFLTDHILTTFSERVSQQSINDVGLSDLQLMYCTRKFSHTKVRTHKQITFRSLKIILPRPIKRVWGKYTFQIMKTLVTWTELMKTPSKDWWPPLLN